MDAHTGGAARARARGGAVLALLLVALPAAVVAATFTVTNLDDGGPGSLRDAIAQANSNAGPDTVNFAVNGTIVLTSGAIPITEALTITGPGAAQLLIDGNANNRIFLIQEASPLGCPALTGPSDYLVTISGVTLQNAHRNTDNSAGAIFTVHSLNLDSVVIRDNQAKAGGGLTFGTQYAGQTLTISNSVFSHNIAKPLSVVTSNQQGGAFRVVENCGGTNVNTAIPVTVTVTNTLFTGNRVQPQGAFSGWGGAIYSSAYADITITDSRIVGNFVDAPNPPVANQSYQGGAIRGFAKSWTIQRTEISDNAVFDATGSDQTRGGAIEVLNYDPNLQGAADVSPMKIIDSTISGNSVPSTSGAILAFGNVALELDNTTVAYNMAASGRTGGIIMSTGATSPPSSGNATAPTLKMVSSILARSSPGTGDLSTNVAVMPSFTVDATNSLIQSICPTCNITVSGSGNVLSGLGTQPLGYWGGPSRTHQLYNPSPPIDAGSNPLSLATDQRGFPRVAGAGADMGSYEWSTYTPNPTFAYFLAGNNVQIVDGATNTLLGTVPVGNNPYAAVVNPAGTRVYVSAFGDNAISVVETNARIFYGTIPVAAGPQGLALDPTGSRLYVACFTAGILGVYDVASRTLIASIPVPGAVDVVVNNAGTRAYVASGAAITIIDTATNAAGGTIPLPGLGAVGSIAISPDDMLVYAWSNQSAKIAVVDTATNTMTTTIPIAAPFGNDGIVFHPAGGLAYHSTGTQISVIDTQTSQVVRTIPLGTSASGVNGLAIAADGTRLFAATANGVRIVDTSYFGAFPVGSASVRAMGHFAGPLAPSFPTMMSGPVATGVGSARVSAECAGVTRCVFTQASWIAPPGNAGSPPIDAAIQGVAFPYGLAKVSVIGFTGFSATLTMVFPAPLPPGTALWKFGPTSGNPSPHWYTLPATIAGNTITYTIVDGGVGDDDLVANSVIVDAAGPAVAYAGRVLVPDGTSVSQSFAAYPETRWFAMMVEPGKTYVIETSDGADDLASNAIGSVFLYGEDRYLGPPEASYNCASANSARPPAVDVAADGIRCVLVAGLPYPGLQQNRRPVYIAVNRMDPLAGGGSQFRIRARESTMYGRWITSANYDYHVELQNTTVDPMCAWVTRYPASGLHFAPGGGWSGGLLVDTLSVPGFGAVKEVINHGNTVGADSEGALRIGACGSSPQVVPAGLQLSTYAFDTAANRYIYFFTSTANEGKTRSSW